MWLRGAVLGFLIVVVWAAFKWDDTILRVVAAILTIGLLYDAVRKKEIPKIKPENK